MRILIHALAVRQHGGTARHLTNFIPALGEYGADNQYILYIDQDFSLPSVPPNVIVHSASIQSSWHRVLWDVYCLPKIAKQTHVQAIWNLLGFGMLDTSIPQIMFQRVSTYYCHQYLTTIDSKTRWLTAIRRWWQAIIMKRSAHIITPTATMREMIRTYHTHLPLSQFSVLPHAFNLDALVGGLTTELQEHFTSLPAKAIKLLYVGHMLPYKELFFMLDVFNEVQKNGARPLYWYLTIGPEDWPEGYTMFMARRRDYQLEKHVIILGKQPSTVVGALYRHCEIILSPSLCESFGWPMLEGTSLSKPFLAVDTPLNQEMLGSGAAYYTVQDQVTAKNQLLELILNRQKRIELGEAGHKHFEKNAFDWEKYVKYCHEITQQTINTGLLDF